MGVCRSLENTDAESKKVEQECKNHENELGALEKRTAKVHREVRHLEDVVMETLNSQATLKKGSRSTLQAVEKMKEQIREKARPLPSPSTPRPRSPFKSSYAQHTHRPSILSPR